MNAANILDIPDPKERAAEREAEYLRILALPDFIGRQALLEDLINDALDHVQFPIRGTT